MTAVAGLPRATRESPLCVGIEELRSQISDLFSFKEVKPEVFLQRIAFNLIPQIGPFYDDGYCEEEVKMINESRKILSMPKLDIDVTTVRVPTFFSHAETVCVSSPFPWQPLFPSPHRTCSCQIC